MFATILFQHPFFSGLNEELCGRGRREYTIPDKLERCCLAIHINYIRVHIPESAAYGALLLLLLLVVVVVVVVVVVCVNVNKMGLLLCSPLLQGGN